MAGTQVGIRPALALGQKLRPSSRRGAKTAQERGQFL